MLSPEWLHCCGPRVYLFDWFKCITAGYASSAEGLVHQPPPHHFLRHSCYFSESANGNSSKKRKKRRTLDTGSPDAPMAACAQYVRRAVSDDWHRPKVSWVTCAPPANRVETVWPDFVGKFDSAALLGFGSWQPFLQATMENASEQCSVLDIGAAAPLC
jgi:hypothetical protein